MFSICKVGKFFQINNCCKLKTYFIRSTIRNQNIPIQNVRHILQFAFKHTDSFNHKYTPFPTMIAQRRLEAKKSILVQVNSERSYGELYTYCSQYGTIESMQHYSTGTEPLHFIIIEFKNESDVTKVLSISQHVLDSELNLIPVTSPLLWFRATPKSKKRLMQLENFKLISENGTHIHTQDEIKKVLQNCNNISDQMTQLYHKTCLSETGTRLRFIVCRQIELAIKGMFPNAMAIPFGSSVNGFGKEGCDLDTVLNFEKNTVNTDSNMRLAFHSKAGLFNGRSQTQRYMECVADIIQLFLPGCANVRRILQARVPIIKYNHELTGLECDLSMINMSGVYMSDLLYTLASIDTRVRPLVFTVKKWAESCGLTASTPGRWITNFGLTLLVLGFLQQVSILPSIETLVKLAEDEDKAITAEGVNCTFLHDITKLPSTYKENTNSLENLLFQFFEYYSSFDFESKAISLNTGKSIIKPEHTALYIVNPLERHLNVSKNVSIEELERLRIELRNAAWALESNEIRNKSGVDNWGLMHLLLVKNKERNAFYMNPTQNRLVEIKNLFEEQGGEDKPKVQYKSEKLQKEVQQIKSETSKKIRNLSKKVLNKTRTRYR